MLGDLKPDFRELIGTSEEDGGLGGVVLSVGPGAGTFNPLDLGALRDAADRIGGQVGVELLALATSKAVDLMIVLATITRGKPLEDYEETLLAVAIALTYTLTPKPNLHTLVDVLQSGRPELLQAAVSDSEAGYLRDTRTLMRTLRSMLEGPMGEVFGADTTTAFPLDTPGGVCVDISALSKAPKKLLAAVLVATWTHGFLSVDAHWELAQAGLAEWRGFLIVLDELWKAMGVAPGLVELIDQLTRTNRADGVGDVKISHSPKDAQALPNEVDRITAAGFAERAGMVALFGLSRQDLEALNGTSVELSQNEIDTVTSWRSPRSMRARRRQSQKPLPPPGAGKVLLKLGGAPGIATKIVLTAAEHALHDTNQRW
ncbi:ATP/GTP-binding protein [Plantibacter sp. CFBP 8775]|uniref:ATP/GTP-binding protein n=1 Tax=Plantibacter sp. CFBP 8775 TaxID=2774038 RepID=UPI0017862234|nr:ATP/GTP-binding protein [Plantibacter sp. CFBP 8775]MBD8104760.1 ATP/GTP-binding protein [Plantibacter sp. CFBP 8775]